MKTISALGKIDAIALGNYILKHYGPMSHLKLQKLLFYCDAYHLAYFETEIIPESFEAWVHGPVCREVYNSLKDNSILHTDLEFDINSDQDPDNVINDNLNSSQLELTKSILNTLHSWTGIELEASTHLEWPWIEARNGLPPSTPCSNKISKVTTQKFYFNEVNGN